jgi:Calx-beta domain/FG-GAP-like repeat/FG-GAP repeat
MAIIGEACRLFSRRNSHRGVARSVAAASFIGRNTSSFRSFSFRETVIMAFKPPCNGRSNTPAKRRPTRSAHLRYEQLEGRFAPALFNVQSPVTIGSQKNFGCVATGDFNGDGNTDAVLTNYGTAPPGATPPNNAGGNTISIILGNGNGTFGSASTITIGSNQYVSFVAVGDLNADGNQDLAVVSTNEDTSGMLRIYLGSGSGGFALSSQGAISVGSNNACWVGFAQMTNGDTNLDVVVSSFGTTDSGETTVYGNQIDIFQGDGTGLVGNIATITNGISFMPTALALADFDGDGSMDVAATVPGVPPDTTSPQPNGEIQIVNGNGAGGFTIGNSFDSGGALPINIQTADLNGDARPDLVIANAGDPDGSNFYQNFGANSSVGLAINAGGGSFNTFSPLTAGLGAGGSKSVFAVAIADLNLDGKQDIAAIVYGNPLSGAAARVLAFKGDGNSGFTADANSPYNTNATGGQYLAVAPLDANGSPDIIYSTDSSRYGVLLNTTVIGPSVTINQGSTQLDPTNVPSIVYDVVFSADVTGFTSAGVDLTGSTGSGAGLSATIAETDARHYTVTVTGMAAGTTGTVKAKILANAATAITGGAPNSASTSTDNSVKYDYQAPTVTINQAGGQADPATTGPILFTVVFSEPVSGFTSSDVDLLSSSFSGLSANVTQNTTSNYTVSVSGMSGGGTVVAKVFASSAADAAGNLNAASTSNDNTVTFGTPGPTVTINQAAGQLDPTNSSSILFDVVFSAGVTGFTSSGVDLTGSSVAGLSATITPIDSSHYTVGVSGMTGTGTVKATITSGAATAIAGGVSSQASTSGDNQVTFDLAAPTVTIEQAGGQADPATTGPITFTVNFSEPVTGFTGTDVDLTGSSLSGLSASVAQNTTSNYTVTVSGMGSAGTIVAKVKPGGATDLAGNSNSASTSNDNTVTYSPIAGAAGTITLALATYAVQEEIGAYSVQVNRTGGSSGDVSVTFAVTDGTATALSDYKVNNIQQTFSWVNGDTSPRYIDFSILDDTISEGKETLNIQLSNATNGAFLGTASAVLTIKPSEGLPVGQFRYTDDNDLATIKLGPATAGGLAQVYMTNGASPISLIELSGTNPAKTTLSLSIKKGGDGTIAIGSITGSGLKSINLSKAQLNGEGINLTGPVQSINLNGIYGGADIIAAGSVPGKKTRITVKNGIANGTDVTLNQPLALLKAAAYGTGGKITVPSIGTVSIKGNFKSDVTVTGAGAGNTSIGSFNVLGQVDGSTINVVNGNVKTFKVGTFINSLLDVGYSGDKVGNGNFDDPTSTIGTFKTSFKSSAAFKNSSVIAANMNSVLLSGVDDQNNGNEFGIFTNSFKTVAIMLPTKVMYKTNVGGASGNFSVKVLS